MNMRVLYLLIGLGFLSSTAVAEQIGKKELVDYLDSSMPKLICEDTAKVFLTCFKGVTAAQCKSTVATLSKSCIATFENDMPDIMQLADVEKWAGQIGHCIGENYRKKYEQVFDKSCENS